MSWAAHLPALQVVVPLLAAPLTVLLRRRDLAFAVALAACWIAFAIALLLWQQVDAFGTISYEIGRWKPPWGIEYRVDRLTTFVLVLVSGIGALVLPFARGSIEREIEPRQQYLFYTMVLLCLTGMFGMTITGDAFNVFVFLEISSLSTYVLIAFGRDRRALFASYQYLVMGTIGATFFVIGIGLLYLMTGTLNIADMGQRITEVRGTRPVLAALAFLTVGLSLKLALFPLHQWLPNAYAYAPSAVSALLAATATKVALYVLVRFYYGVFGRAQVFGPLPMEQVMLLLALAGIFGASMVAVFQTELKRLFAYSSVGQIGYIVLGLSFASATGLTASIVHLFNHGITKGAIFLLLGCIAARLGDTSLARVHGLGRTMPWTSAGLVLCGLSLIGVPGTAGFVTKWYLVLAALERDQWWLVFLIVGSSLLSMAYVWRFVEAAYFRPSPPDTTPLPALPWGMRVTTALLVASTLWFGIDTSQTVTPAAQAAASLIGGRR
jgi:multicomponent Na+:H+ antiporter subunit D